MSKNDIKVHVDNDVVAVSVEKENKRGEDRDDQGVRYDTAVCAVPAVIAHSDVSTSWPTK